MVKIKYNNKEYIMEKDFLENNSCFGCDYKESCSSWSCTHGQCFITKTCCSTVESQSLCPFKNKDYIMEN
jgi:hypothetical protein